MRNEIIEKMLKIDYYSSKFGFFVKNKRGTIGYRIMKSSKDSSFLEFNKSQSMGDFEYETNFIFKNDGTDTEEELTEILTFLDEVFELI